MTEAGNRETIRAFEEAAVCGGAVLDRAGKGLQPNPFPLPYKIPRGGTYAAVPMQIPGQRIGEQSE